MPNLRSVVDGILGARSNVLVKHAVLVRITGIDGSGKGYVTLRIAEALHARRIRVAAINIDGWLNLPAVRFEGIYLLKRAFQGYHDMSVWIDAMCCMTSRTSSKIRGLALAKRQCRNRLRRFHNPLRRWFGQTADRPELRGVHSLACRLQGR